MVKFGELESWIRAGDVDAVVTGLSSLGEPARRALATEVKALRMHWDTDDLHSLPWERRMSHLHRRAAALCVAGAACLPRAADVVSFLRSDRFWHPPLPEAVDAVARVLQLPGRPSMPAIARSMADKLRPAQVDVQWPLIARLLTESGLPLPATEAALRGWMRLAGEGRYREDLADLLRIDPHTAEMLPHVFTIPLLGQELDEEWTKALAKLSAQGVVDRQALLDGCVLRLHTGDRTGAIRRMVVLHRLLDPVDAEIAARRGEYSTMLSSPDSIVVDLALRGLRLADDAGLIEVETVAEAAWTVLLRKEKKLVRTQLDWLAAALTRKPDPLLFEALLSGLANPATDLAERALALAGKHLPSFGPTGVSQLATAASTLRGDLHRQATALLAAADPTNGRSIPAPVLAIPIPATTSAPGITTPATISGGTAASDPTESGSTAGCRSAGDPAASGSTASDRNAADGIASDSGASDRSASGETGVFSGVIAIPLAASPAPMPDPIASIPELIAEIKHMLRQEEDPVRAELILDGLVRFAASDRPALASALRPVIPEHWTDSFSHLLRSVGDRRYRARQADEWERTAAPPFWMLAERMGELTRQMCETPPPALLATPATVDGHVDPARVLRLLGEGWTPGPFDLSQALLRLPREVAPTIHEAAARLTSPAGRAFAAYLAGGGLPDPRTVTLTPDQDCSHPIGRRCGCFTGRRTVAFEAIESRLTVPPHLLSQPAKTARERAHQFRWGGRMEGWPLIFPSHRELAAAHIQPFLISVPTDKSAGWSVGVLLSLAACDGPFGPAMALCMAYGLTAARPEARRITTDAFLELSVRDVLDGTVVGTELAALHAGGSLILKRTTESLTEALDAGAAVQVWSTLLPLLRAVLSAPAPASGTPDLLLLASSAAAATGATDEIPELAPMTTRPGRSRLLTEAARLSRTLATNNTR